jgi:hypothetical protein
MLKVRSFADRHISDLVGGALTMGLVNVDPNLPVNIQLVASVWRGTSNSLNFPIGIDVFTLPDGYTANDPDTFLVDNRFLPPNAATALPLFASGLSAIGLISSTALAPTIG